MRTDAVDVYVFREFGGDQRAMPERAEFLQIRRVKEPAAGTWQTVMGGIDEGEKAIDAAMRELREEIGAEADDVTGLWFLGQAGVGLRGADAAVRGAGAVGLRAGAQR